MPVQYVYKMKTLHFLILTISLTVFIFGIGSASAQYGGIMVRGSSTSLSQIVASENNVYAIWYDTNPHTGSTNAFLKTSTDGGTSFGKAINLTSTLGIKPSDFTAKFGLAADENDVYLAWGDWKNNDDSSNVFIAKSIDNGNTFGKPVAMKTGLGISGIAQLAASGNKVYALMGNSTNSAYSDLLFRTSNDGAMTFGKTVSLSTDHHFMIGDAQMKVSGNDIYIVEDGQPWGSQNGAILFSSSHDGGSTFDHVTISDGAMEFTPQLAVSEKNVYVVWMEMSGQTTNLFLKKSSDGGMTFSDKVRINKDGTDVRWPQMVLANGTDNNILYVKWIQSLPSGKSNLMFATSMDSGNTFDNPINLESFTTGNFDFSEIGLMGNNSLYAIWTGEYDPSYSQTGVFFRTSTGKDAAFGDIFDLNHVNTGGLTNPKVALLGNHLYVGGDTGTFRTSNDFGVTFNAISNLDTVEPVKSGVAIPLFKVPEFKQDVPTSEPPNSHFSNSQNASFVLGQPNFVSNSQSPTAHTFFTPHFIAFDSQGDMWVSDGGNDRVLEFKPPFVMGENASVVLGQHDFTSWQVLNGTNSKSLWHPQGLAFDREGNLWVADGASNRVLEFKAPFGTGQEPSLVLGHKDFTSEGQTIPTTSSSMYYPEGLAFDKNGNLWVADASGRMLEFAQPFSNGEDASIVLEGANPVGMAFDSAGNLWVADIGKYSILRFDAPLSSNVLPSLVLGHHDFTSGAEGVSSNSSSLRDPFGITFDSDGNLWVTDSGNNRVLEFTYPFTNGQSASLLIGQTSFNAGAVDTMGHTTNLLNQPHGIAFDKNGNLWVADSENNRILVFKSKQSNDTSQIIFQNPTIDLGNVIVSGTPNAYEKAANDMEECSKKLGIASDNKTAINLVLGSSQFQSNVTGYDYKLNGITNSFHSCALDEVDVVYALYDKNGTYEKSLYVSVNPSLTKILGIKEEVDGMSYGGAIIPSSVNSSNVKQNTSQKIDVDIVYKSSSLNYGNLLLFGTMGCVAGGIVIFLVWYRKNRS